MQIENGRFYFINNTFIQTYGIKYNLMKNKETGTKRPCYFCFKDKTDKHIIWFVPISKQYEKYKVRYALYLLEWLYSRPIEEFDESIYKNIVEDVTIVASTIYENSVTSREKDYTDYFRTMVYRNEKEMNAVVGALQENEFLLQLKEDTRQFILDIERVFQGIIH